MAKQSGHLFITGTIHDVTYYKMDGTYYARMKSSLSRKTVLTSPRFVRTRMHASQLADASKIASQVYRMISKAEKNMQLFRSIVGKAKVLLVEGKEKEEVIQLLKNELFPQEKVVVPKPIKKKKSEERIYVSKAGKLIWRTSTNIFKKRFPVKLLSDEYFSRDRKRGINAKERVVYKE